jgi:hypothetical protein
MSSSKQSERQAGRCASHRVAHQGDHQVNNGDARATEDTEGLSNP